MWCALLLTFSGFAVYFCCFASPSKLESFWSGREERRRVFPPLSGRLLAPLVRHCTAFRVSSRRTFSSSVSVASFFVSVFPSFICLLLHLLLSLYLFLYLLFLTWFSRQSWKWSVVSHRPVALFRLICSLIDGGCFSSQTTAEVVVRLGEWSTLVYISSHLNCDLCW